MRLKFLGIGLLVLSVINLATTKVSAQTTVYNQRLTVYAQVAPMRIIFINSDQKIIKVAGNTADNIDPRVVNENQQSIQLTMDVHNQYAQILNENNGRLDPGKEYIVNPLQIKLSAAPKLYELSSEFSR